MNNNQIPPPATRYGETAASRPLVSIVIPVYNAEKYLTATLESILAQTFTEFEVICVNNGSADNSAQILADFAKKDNRIKVKEIKENKGPNPARNLGLSLVSGKWIMIMDSDDLVPSNALQSLIDAAKRFPDANIIKGSHDVLLENGRQIATKFANQRRPFANKPMQGDEFLRDILNMHGVYFAYIFSTELIKNNDVKFNEDIFANGIDDQPFLLKAMLFGKAVYIEESVYIYRLFAASTSNTVRPSQRVIKADIEAVREFKRLIDLAPSELYRKEISKFLDANATGVLVHILKSDKSARSRWFKELKSQFPWMTLQGDMRRKAIALAYNFVPFVFRLL